MTPLQQSSDEILIALALHYGLIDIGPLSMMPEAPDARKLVELGVLSDGQLAFLRRKAARTLQTSRFLELAERLGHLAPGTAVAMASRLRVGQLPDREYEAASLLHGAGRMGLYQVVDVLEELGLPLQHCDACLLAYYPPTPDEVDPDAICPRCGSRLEGLTTLPERGLGGPPLPELEKLTVARLPSRAQGNAGVADPMRLVLNLAARYRLVSPEQARLLEDRKARTLADAVRGLLEEGLLTTGAVRFLRARAEEIVEAGHGVVGTQTGGEPLELAVALGYLDRSAAAAVRRSPGYDLEGSEPDRQRREAALLQLLFNQGELRLYEVLDLLEKRGIVLDHCASCQSQVLTDAAESQPCPSCDEPQLRITGWSRAEQLTSPIPAIERLAIRHGRAATEAATTSAGQSQRIVMVADAPMELPDVEPLAVYEVLRRYRVLDAEQLRQLSRLVESSDAPALQVLAEFGFVDDPGLAFVVRTLQPPAEPISSGLSELAVERRYCTRAGLGRASSPLGELKSLVRAFNNGALPLYQLVDLLESTGTRLEHCGRCQRQFALPDDGETDSLCLRCGQPLVPLHRPRASSAPPVVPELGRLNLVAIDIEEPEPVEAAGAAPEAVTERSASDRERVVARLVRRYGLVSRPALQRARAALPADGDLERMLFDRGHLTSSQFSFLVSKRQQLASGGGQFGALAGHRLVDVATSKGYLTPDRLEKVAQAPGVPELGGGQELELAAFLHTWGALAIYQLVDVFEECGVYVAACGPCGRQLHLDGKIDPEHDYACPRCGGTLLPMTSVEGREARLEQVLPIRTLHLERLSVAELKTTRRRRQELAPGDSGEMQAVTVPAADAAEVEARGRLLDLEAPAASPPSASTLEERREQASALRRRSQALVREFYEEAFGSPVGPSASRRPGSGKRVAGGAPDVAAELEDDDPARPLLEADELADGSPATTPAALQARDVTVAPVLRPPAPRVPERPSGSARPLDPGDQTGAPVFHAGSPDETGVPLLDPGAPDETGAPLLPPMPASEPSDDADEPLISPDELYGLASEAPRLAPLDEASDADEPGAQQRSGEETAAPVLRASGGLQPGEETSAPVLRGDGPALSAGEETGAPVLAGAADAPVGQVTTPLLAPDELREIAAAAPAAAVTDDIDLRPEPPPAPAARPPFDLRQAGWIGLALAGAVALGLVLRTWLDWQARPRSPVAGDRVRMAGKVEPGSVSEEGGPPRFLLAIDLDRYAWVRCETEATKAQLAMLASRLQAAKKTLWVEVDGTLGGPGPAVAPGRPAPQLSAVKVRLITRLPERRVRILD